MWSRETSKSIAMILNLIAEMPNSRPHATDSSITIFDGGIMRVISAGLTGYEFTDGTKAIFGTGLNIGLSIAFPSGEQVTLSSTYTYCGGCLKHLSVDTRYCSKCGLQNPEFKNGK